MAYKVFVCESCSSELAVDAKSRERPAACPKCRGMLILDRTSDDFSGDKVDCPECGNSFFSAQAPFKCAFCDHSFIRRYTYF